MFQKNFSTSSFDLFQKKKKKKKKKKNSPEEIVAAAELQARAFYTSYPLGPLDALMFYQFRVREEFGEKLSENI